MKIKADIDIMSIIVHGLLWIILSIITFGIAMFFMPYSFAKFVINRTTIIADDGSEKKLVCHTDIVGQLGHIVLWFFITLLTLGLGYFFYLYKVWNYSLNKSTSE